MEPSLFLVVLGGRTSKSNIELHDIRWVVGESIEDTFPELRKQWFGQKKGLHIDSYKCIKYIDGYKILIKNTTEQNISCSSTENNFLWFINLGGYTTEKMSEEHEFSLIAAKTALEAKKKAKKKWVLNLKGKHNDDFSEIRNFKQIDDLHSIKKIKEWEINLIPDPQKRNQRLIPDWFGYWRIDNF